MFVSFGLGKLVRFLVECAIFIIIKKIYIYMYIFIYKKLLLLRTDVFNQMFIG